MLTEEAASLVLNCERLCSMLTAGAEEREPSSAAGLRTDAGLTEFVFGSAFAGVDFETHGIHRIVCFVVGVRLRLLDKRFVVRRVVHW